MKVKTRTGLHGPFFLRIDKMPALFSLAEAVSVFGLISAGLRKPKNPNHINRLRYTR